MAYENHNWAWRVVGLRGSHYVALHCLANEAGGNGIVQRLKLKTLARRCNVTYATARGLVADLAKWGLIGIECRSTATGKQVSNCYRLQRNQLFPTISPLENHPTDQSGDHSSENGAIIGRLLWSRLLTELEQARGAVEVYLLRNQIREAYFDCSTRPNKTDQRLGVLYLIAETDTVKQAFRENLNYLYKFRAQGNYLVDYLELVERPQFDDVSADQEPAE